MGQGSLFVAIARGAAGSGTMAAEGVREKPRLGGGCWRRNSACQPSTGPGSGPTAGLAGAVRPDVRPRCRGARTRIRPGSLRRRARRTPSSDPPARQPCLTVSAANPTGRSCRRSRAPVGEDRGPDNRAASSHPMDGGRPGLASWCAARTGQPWVGASPLAGRLAGSPRRCVVHIARGPVVSAFPSGETNVLVLQGGGALGSYQAGHLRGAGGPGPRGRTGSRASPSAPSMRRSSPETRPSGGWSE